MNYVGNSPPLTGSVALDALAARVAALEARQTIRALVAASGTAVEFLNIPQGIKKLWVHLYALSTNGASPLMLQVGDSIAGWSGVGYASTSLGGNNGAFVGSQVNVANGFCITSTNAAAITYHGMISLVLAGGAVPSGAHVWVSQGTLNSEVTAYQVYVSSGSKILTTGSYINQLRLLAVNGTDSLDNGQVGIAYE